MTDGLQQTVSPNDVLIHFAVALQQIVGFDLECADAEMAISGATPGLFVPYESVTVCEAAVVLALTLLRLCVLDSQGDEREARDRVQSFYKRFHDYALPVQDREIVRQARKRDIPVHRLAGRWLLFGQGRFQQRMNGTKTSLTGSVGNSLASNKDYSRQLMRDSGLPVPTYRKVSRESEAKIVAKEIGYPLVVKPNKGNVGRDVHIGIEDLSSAVKAFKQVRRNWSAVYQGIA
jgi:cyanophycin synthetase